MHSPHGEGVARGLDSGGEGDGELSRHLLGRVTDPARRKGAIKLHSIGQDSKSRVAQVKCRMVNNMLSPIQDTQRRHSKA